MSLDVDLLEFRTAYLAEVDELLTSVRANFVELETAIAQGRSTARQGRELLRALHTIKGLSAMVGIEPIVTISHKMENVLRAVSRAGATVDDRLLQALVEGTNAIQQRLRSVADHQPVSPPSSGLLRALDVDVKFAEPAAASGELLLDAELALKLAPDERARLLECEGNVRAVRIDFVPSPSRAETGLNITSVRERLGAMAEIVRVLPTTLAAAPDAPGGLCFVILARTEASDEAISAAVGIAPEDVHCLAPRETKGGDDDAIDPLAPEEPFDIEPPRRGLLRVDVARIDQAIEKLSALIVTRWRLQRAINALGADGVNTRDLLAIMHDNARQLRELRSAMLQVRMIPVSEMLDRMPLVVRELRRTSGKAVALEMNSGGAELDKSVAERLFPALVHLVRNAIDHGIEPSAERARLGKPAEARIRIACATRANRLEVSVSDDGAGIDRAKVISRAGRDAPSSAALLDLLCRPGLSTRDVASTTSGRGIGMDIVRRVTVEQLGGELVLETREGRGTTFVIRVPLTIAVVDAFTIDCAGQRFVVPVPMVEEIVELAATGRVEVPHREGARLELLHRRGAAIPLVHLADRLGVASERADSLQALIIRRGHETLAFAVGRVLGQQETVVRPLEDPLVQVPGISGSTDLGDGRPTLVLDMLTLATNLWLEELAA